MNTIIPGSNCFIYIRVSTKKQSNKGYSLESQEAACNIFAEQNKLEVIKTFKDEGESGKSMNRKEFQSLLSCVRKDEYILVYSITRLGRNQTEAMTVADNLNNRGVHLLSCKEPGINISTPSGRFMLSTLLGFAEYELNEIDSRSKAVLRNKEQCGEQIGRLGYGYEINLFEGRKYRYPIVREQEAITYAISERNKCPPTGWRTLAKAMIDRGWMPKHKGSKWSNSSLQSVVSRQSEYREKHGLENLTAADVEPYERHRSPLNVPYETLINNIDQDTGHLDYVKVFGYKYGAGAIHVPPPEKFKSDIDSGRLILPDHLKKEVDEFYDEPKTIDLSAQDADKLKLFFNVFGSLKTQEEIQEKARLFFSQ